MDPKILSYLSAQLLPELASIISEYVLGHSRRIAAIAKSISYARYTMISEIYVDKRIIFVYNMCNCGDVIGSNWNNGDTPGYKNFTHYTYGSKKHDVWGYFIGGRKPEGGRMKWCKC